MSQAPRHSPASDDDLKRFWAEHNPTEARMATEDPTPAQAAAMGAPTKKEKGKKQKKIALGDFLADEATGSWAERHRVGYTTYTDLSQKPEIYELVAGEVAKANAQMPPGTRTR